MFFSKKSLIFIPVVLMFFLSVISCVRKDPSTDFIRMHGQFAEGKGFILVEWEPSKNPEAGGYFVYIGKRKHGKKVKINSELIRENRYVIKGLAIGQTYYIQISTGTKTMPLIESDLSPEFSAVAQSPDENENR